MVAVNDMGETREYTMLFHNDAHHEYKFDGTSLQNIAVYGLARGEERERINWGRVTARTIVPITSNGAHKGVVVETGVVVY